MIYAFICTRSKKLNETATKLSRYLSSASISVKFLVNQNSIFSGYSKAFISNDIKDDDIVILCHDDIEILTDKSLFLEILVNNCLKSSVGFVGVAGTKKLTQNAIWWNPDVWREGKHSGVVWHGTDALHPDLTYYGHYGQVVVMDGLFLAASGRTLKKVSLEKPDYLHGDWDFYDLHYTLTAHKKGLKNLVVPICILHNSKGELVGRDGWDENRKLFIQKHNLPIELQNGN